MKESHNEGVASHIGPESCGGVREGAAEALTGGGMDWVLSLENVFVRSADGFMSHGRQDRHGRQRETGTNSAWSKTPATYRHTSRERPPAALLGTMSSFTEAGRSPGSAPMRVGVRVVNPQGARRR
jgi:hypothetical protein